jgi:hypothetical protein
MRYTGMNCIASMDLQLRGPTVLSSGTSSAKSLRSMSSINTRSLSSID